MRIFRGLVMVVVLLVASTAWAAEFSGRFSLTGATPTRLSSFLSDNGYSRTGDVMQLDVLTICNPSGNAADIGWGQNNVSASNWFNLTPGECYTWPPGSRGTDATAIYLFTASTQTIKVSLRSR